MKIYWLQKFKIDERNKSHKTNMFDIENNSFKKINYSNQTANEIKF